MWDLTGKSKEVKPPLSNCSNFLVSIPGYCNRIFSNNVWLDSAPLPSPPPYLPVIN